jgi:tetratricopeptide (TPR) repeat protein
MLACAELAEAVASRAGRSRQAEAALALAHQGIALNGLGRPVEALEHLALALTALGQVPAGGPNPAAEVRVKLLLNRANVLQRLGRHAESVADYDEAITGVSDLAGADLGRWDALRATALLNRGEAMNRLARPAEALDSHNRAVADLERLAARGGDDAPPGLRAKARLLRGHANRNAARHPEALADYGAAIALLGPLAEGGHDGASHDLALAKLGTAVALDAQGDRENALLHHDRAVAALDQLRRLGKLGDLLGDRAMALTNRAASLQSTGKLDRAIEDYNEAVKILREPAVADDLSLRGRLANTLFGKATALAALSSPFEAIDALDEAIQEMEKAPDSAEIRLLFEHAHELRLWLAYS